MGGYIPAVATSSGLRLKPVLSNGAYLGDGRRVPIAMDEKRVVLAGQLRSAAVDRVADGVAPPSQVEADAGGALPRIGLGLEIVLVLQADAEHTPIRLRRAPRAADRVD